MFSLRNEASNVVEDLISINKMDIYNVVEDLISINKMDIYNVLFKE